MSPSRSSLITETGPKFIMCAKRPCRKDYNGQVDSTNFTHLLRLTSETSVSGLRVNASMPHTIDCHVTDYCSSIYCGFYVY